MHSQQKNANTNLAPTKLFGRTKKSWCYGCAIKKSPCDGQVVEVPHLIKSVDGIFVADRETEAITKLAFQTFL